MQNFIITAAGQELMAKMIAGTSTCTFTKIKTSSHDYTGVDLEELTSLSDIVQAVDPSQVSRTDTTIVRLVSVFTNETLESGYYVKAIGVFAKGTDNVEILYGIAIDPDNPDYMPAYGGQTISSITFNINVRVDNSSQVTIELNPSAVASAQSVQDVQLDIDTHEALSIYSEDGIHGLRYYQDVLSVYNTTTHEWVDVETGGGGIPPSNVSNLSVKAGNTKLTVKWEDPGDTIIDGQVVCTWAGTKLVMKAGAYPTSEKDGTVVVDNQVKDTYKTNGFEITSLTNGTTYYFQLFPYSDSGAVNRNVANRITGTPQAYRTMTATIDLSNSNPNTCISYADDATGMTAGSSDWDDFFGHYPCLLKNGVEGGKLKTSDFSKYEDGTSADITSGSDGDVMIAFPRRGVKISTSGTTVTVSMTDNPDDSNFKYYAHQRGSTDKDIFYLGAYKGYESSSKLRSLSGKTITANKTIGAFRTSAQANGTGYDQSGFYQLVFRQVMYILKYKSLDSQSTLGRGYVDGNSAAISTGGTNAKGMDFGESTGKLQMKLFGIEDFWGNIWEWIDGIVTNSTRNLLTATTSFNDSGTGYTDRGQGATADLSNYISKPQGTSETGFIAKEVSGSSSTYFCDYGSLYASKVAIFGGKWNDAGTAGAFSFGLYYASSNSDASITARLMYL